MAAPDFIAARTMGMRVITEVDMEAQPIGMTVPGMHTVHEVALLTGMMGLEVQLDGAAARRRGTMARVTSADIEEARRTGAAAPEVRPDGVAAARLGAADRARGTAPVVARVRGGVERPVLARGSSLYSQAWSGIRDLWQSRFTNGCLARGFLIEPLNEA